MYIADARHSSLFVDEIALHFFRVTRYNLVEDFLMFDIDCYTSIDEVQGKFQQNFWQKWIKIRDLFIRSIHFRVINCQDYQ